MTVDAVPTGGHVKAEITRYMRLLYERGLISSLSGNISARTGDIIYISPTKIPSYRIKNSEVSVVTITGERLEGSDPSSELPIHLAIYRTTPANAVVHTHSHYATILACLRRELHPPDVEGRYLVGDLPLIPYEEPGSSALGKAVSDGLHGNKGVLLERHGVLSSGADLESAFIWAEAIERSARLAFDLEVLNRR